MPSGRILLIWSPKKIEAKHLGLRSNVHDGEPVATHQLLAVDSHRSNLESWVVGMLGTVFKIYLCKIGANWSKGAVNPATATAKIHGATRVFSSARRASRISIQHGVHVNVK